MTPDAGTDDAAPLGRSSGRRRADPVDDQQSQGQFGPSTSSQGNESPPADQEQAAAQPARNCLIAGPIGAGKTAFLGALWDACADSDECELDITLGFGPEMAELVASRTQKRNDRRGLDASASNREYRFTVTADRRAPGNYEVVERVGVRAFSCMDGPGGALFTTNFQPASLPPDMQSYRRELVDAGRTASSLVFFIDTMTDAVRSLVVGNLPHVLGDLAVPTSVPTTIPRPTQSTGFWNWLTPRRNGSLNQPDPNPTREEVAFKLNADRILFVLNRIDQVCLHWQEQWQRSGDSRSSYHALRIARECARPMPLAFQVLGRSFFKKVRGFLKSGATMAVAVCSAGGFDKVSGDPCLDAAGNPNLLMGIDPRSQEGRVKLYGVREAILYAGFGIIEDESIVEEITFDKLVGPQVNRS